MRAVAPTQKWRAALLLLALLLPASCAMHPALAQVRGLNNAIAGQCTGSKVYDASTSGRTELVALSAGRPVYICSLALWAGAVATNVGLVYGTGTACATGETALTPMFQLAANTGIIVDAGLWNGLTAPAGNALCIKTSAGNAVQGLVTYVQQATP